MIYPHDADDYLVGKYIPNVLFISRMGPYHEN